MSVVAAKVYRDKIVMAADSIRVRGWSKETNRDFSKIANINEMIVGGTGLAEELSLMWHFMVTHKPAKATEKDVLAFILEFAKWKTEYSDDSSVQNTYLLAYQGRLFYIESLLVYEVQERAAIGAGEDHALAVLHLGHTPTEAVKVACELGCFVSEPIIEYSMSRDKEV